MLRSECSLIGYNETWQEDEKVKEVIEKEEKEEKDNESEESESESEEENETDEETEDEEEEEEEEEEKEEKEEKETILVIKPIVVQPKVAKQQTKQIVFDTASQLCFIKGENIEYDDHKWIPIIIKDLLWIGIDEYEFDKPIPIPNSTFATSHVVASPKFTHKLDAKETLSAVSLWPTVSGKILTDPQVADQHASRWLSISDYGGNDLYYLLNKSKTHIMAWWTPLGDFVVPSSPIPIDRHFSGNVVQFSFFALSLLEEKINSHRPWISTSA